MMAKAVKAGKSGKMALATVNDKRQIHISTKTPTSCLISWMILITFLWDRIESWNMMLHISMVLCMPWYSERTSEKTNVAITALVQCICTQYKWKMFQNRLMIEEKGILSFKLRGDFWGLKTVSFLEHTYTFGVGIVVRCTMYSAR